MVFKIYSFGVTQNPSLCQVTMETSVKYPASLILSRVGSTHSNTKKAPSRQWRIFACVMHNFSIFSLVKYPIMETFNNNIREWRRKSIRLKTWETFGFFSPSTKITMESGKQHRKRGLHHGGVEHLQSTAPPHQKSIMKKMSNNRKSRK